jgi:hypothetical protein
MLKRQSCFRGGPLAVLLALVVAGIVPTADAEGPITVTYTTTGDVVPGGTVMVQAAVEIGDGSTLQSLSWSQGWGADAELSNTSTDTVTVMFASTMDYKEFLFHVLMEPPLGEDDLPENVPVPEGEFPGGQQDRFEVVGVDPFSLEEAALVTLELEVVTTSGTYHDEYEIHTPLPWKPAVGIRTVPIGNPVLLHGKEQESYDWTLDLPPASNAVLMDATSQYPEFTPDVPGLYKVEVTDLTDMSKEGPVLLRIYAGTWHGIIVGQDADGRPVSDPSCTGCHSGSPAPDKFTPWAQTGHAEIFADMLNTNTHYSTSCLGCHTVGFDPLAEAGGIDEADDYLDFLMEIGDLESAGAYDPTETYHFHADPENWNTTVDEFPETARLGNIQCENCHGPQDAASHSNGAPRISLASKVCAVCHGEPPRHGRYQQWQLSKHADYELAIEEGTSSNCSRCHSANGFIQWVTELDGDAEAEVEITWTEDEIHPQTCQACHDPHDIGTTTEGAQRTNATVRVMGDTPETVGGYTATDVGKGAVCIMCHNGRRGLRNDQNYLRSDATRAPHPGPQGDVLMGQNAYFVQVGHRSYHADVENACVSCHMQSTPPPDIISYRQGGTNHTFYASNEICSDCHAVIVAEDVQGPVEEGMHELEHMLVQGYLNLIESQLALGRTIDMGDATITDSADIIDLVLGERRGRQGFSVDLAGAGMVGPVSLNNIDVITGADTIGFDDLMDDRVLKAGYNYWLLHSDGSHGVHNPSFARAILEASLINVQLAPPTAGGAGSMVGEGEIGEGAVACMSPHVYWAEIAAHSTGVKNSLWRTDVTARNMVTMPADVEFILHTVSGTVTSESTISGGEQGVFEDIVGAMGVEGNGALEICSTQPLEVVARVFNEAAAKSEGGTYGQFIDGQPGGLGLAQGQSARLLGLRQMSGAYRTNISVTNTGLDPAEVRITLYNNSGTELTSYTLEVGSGKVEQDLQPFKNRAGKPNLGWGFAVVEVVEGSGILSSASVADAVTNDATTIPMKW